jgi:hypothetical protein
MCVRLVQLATFSYSASFSRYILSASAPLSAFPRPPSPYFYPGPFSALRGVCSVCLARLVLGLAALVFALVFCLVIFLPILPLLGYS